MEEVAERLAFFDRRVREKIEPALNDVIAQCDLLSTRLREYQELDETLELLQASPGLKQPCLAEVGEGYRQRADLDLTSPVYIEVGLNFFLPFSLADGRDVVKRKLSLLQRQLILCESRKESINRDYVEVFSALRPTAQSLYALESLRKLSQ